MARFGKSSQVARAAAVVIAMGVAATACTTSSDGDDPGSEGKSKGAGSASIAIVADPTTFDPHKASVVQDRMADRMLYETLVGLDDEGKIVPAIAKSWEQTPTSAEFTLNEGVTCTDGSKLTATDVANSVKRFVDPKTGAQVTFGAGNTVTVTADDAKNTVKVELKTPWSDLVHQLGLPESGIVCAKGIKDEAALKKGAKGVGTGRYYLSDSKAGTSYTFTARGGEYTWGRQYTEMPKGELPGKVAFKVMQDEATMANALISGQLDYAGITGADAARFVKNPKFSMKAAPLIRMMVTFNERKGRPMAEPKAREAVAQVLDRAAFNKAVTRDSGSLIAGLSDPSVPCANTDEALLTRTDAAAGGKALKGVKINVVGTNAVAKGAGNEYVQAALKAAGADVKLRNLDNATWGTEVIGGTGDWDITVLPNLNLTGSLMQPTGYLIGEAPPKGRNYGAIESPGFAKGVGEAMATTDQDAKCKAWGDAQKALLTEHHLLPMAAANVNYTTGKRVSIVTPLGAFDPSEIRIVK